MTIRVIVGSKNPVKVRATTKVFKDLFSKVEIDSYDVSKLDSEKEMLKQQPFGENETYEASRCRVRVLMQEFPEYDFYIGIEGGIAEPRKGQKRIILYSTIATTDRIVTVRGCEIPLPPDWFEKLKSHPDLELGDIVSKVSGIDNIKQKQGAVGYFTSDRVTRYDILKESLLMCLIPFNNTQLFWNEYKG